MNPPPAPEKTNKKVSRACNTCRLKRKKCDGLDPCFFCKETKVECSYSREPRRRGPPSGYLRYTETRVTLLETLLGLCILKLRGTVAFSELCLQSVEILRTESKTCTQDVWDAYKVVWTGTDAAKILDDLTNTFAPFAQRTDQETFAKPLLPPPNPNLKAGGGQQQSPSTPSQPTFYQAKANGHSHSPSVMQTTPSPTSEQPHLSYSYSMSRESFERTHTPPPQLKKCDTPVWSREDVDFSFPSTSPTTSRAPLLTYPSPISNAFPVATPPDVEMTTDLDYKGLTDESNPAYTGSYWRSANFEATSPSSKLDFLPPTEQVDLPPEHILTNLIDVYYTHVHPSYPLLPPRHLIEPKLTAPTVPEGTTCLMLALCAYAGRLSPSNPALTVFGGDPSKIAADLWYEQARTAMSALLRKGSRLESVQTLLLLALRDHGRGSEGQAWLLIGLAVRMAQELELKPTSEVWGVCLTLDLLLSLQLGRPPGIVDALRPPPSIVKDSGDLFVQTSSLCRIVSRINLHLYLGFEFPAGKPMETLKAELDRWHHDLPVQFRISLGHQPERRVLEINMFYQVAIILLYRPFFKDKTTHSTFLDAASTFNVLLDKLTVDPSSLAQSNPAMIYLIFTTAIAHLSGYKLSVRPTLRLQTQLHLMNCAEALKTIGETWELARRCWRRLDRLMDIEGKRKRDKEEDHPARNNPGKREEPGSVYTSDGLYAPPAMVDWGKDGVSLSPLFLPGDIFDPSANIFSSGWAPDPAGSGTMDALSWDGEWDEKFWGKSFGFEGMTG
ncbi:uncharacterized protein EV420DRAFT_1751901 [Desarmillaria tabescens]|uniref:Zn(2)-C6 fungal-type domain-containing protein n=1 Tax=Armillaria tabescens TaxID=1929756 RepID=A0AA39JMX8_ARMTA|nr:uncharacterized protein EV420DRAFT_1751901 [Desarmillaria tabescens]KAK0444279.1 hypothetical protein EV420DRAFT_1751901 [Desarmillaria tabescens]